MNKIHQDLIDYCTREEDFKLSLLLDKYGSLYPIDLNHRDFDDMTPLHCASQEGSLKCLNILLKYGVYLEAETKFKRRAIHLAAMRGNNEIISILIKNKCNLNAQDKELNTPLHLACEYNHLESIKILLDNKANYLV